MVQKKKTGCGIICIVFAIISGLFALLILAVTIEGIAEGDTDLIVGGAFVGAPAIIATAMLATMGSKYLKGPRSAASIPGATVAPGAKHVPAPSPADAGGNQIIEITTIAGDAPAEMEVVPAYAAASEAGPSGMPIPVPAPPQMPAASTEPAHTPAAPSRTGLYEQEPGRTSYTYERAVLRSSDVFATLRDFASHPQADPYDASLAAMLAAIGIADWQDAPKVEAVKLGRSGSFWLGSATDELSDEAYDRFLGVECALNVNQAMRHGNRGIQEILRNVIELEPAPSGRSLPGVEAGAEPQGEWMTRLRFAEFAENVAVPFRLAFGMQANVTDGIFVIDLTVPRPDTMGFFAINRSARICTARAYALRSALLCARKAFELNPCIAHVIVNCGVVRSTETFLSMNLDRAALGRLVEAAHDPSIDSSGFPSDPALRASFDDEGWFRSIEPFLSIDAAAVEPHARRESVELNLEAAPEKVAAACGARTIADIGINEHAGRMAALDRYLEGVGSSTGDAVARLVAIRDAAQDVTVAEAADRVSKALVDGSIDVADTDAIARLFVEGSLLDTVAREAQDALDQPEGADLEGHLAKIEDVLSPLTSMGIYLDDTTQVYRYFNALCERVWFNLNLWDGTRAVRLVPDAYYIAHSCAARILSMLDRGDEALAHADELVRIAPATPDAALVRVRVLENMSRVYDASDLLKETISRCSTTRDLSICFYRLAYMEWKLGRSDLAVACYERSIRLGGPANAQARDELEDLIASDSTLAHMGEDEVDTALREEGIPLGNPDGLRQMVARAAIATADANLHSVAAPLTGTLIDLGRDDVLVDLYHSLRISG